MLIFKKCEPRAILITMLFALYVSVRHSNAATSEYVVIARNVYPIELSLSPSESVLVAGCADRAVRTWSLPSFAETTYRERSIPFSASISADRKYIAAASGNSVVIWSSLSKNVVRSIPIKQATFGVSKVACLKSGHNIVVAFTAFSRTPGGPFMVSSCNIDTGRRSWRLHLTQSVNALRLSRNGKFLAVGCIDGNVFLINAITGQFISHRIGSSAIVSIDFSPNDKYIALSARGGLCYVVSISLHTVKLAWQEGSGLPLLAYILGKSTIVTTDLDSSILKVWNSETGRLVSSHKIKSAGIISIAAEKQGKFLYVASSDYSLSRYDVRGLLSN